MSKFNNKDTRTTQWHRCCVYFEQISCFFLVFLFVDFEPVNICWVCPKLFSPLLQCLRNCHEGVFLHSSFWGFAKWPEQNRPISCKCSISVPPDNIPKPKVQEIFNKKELYSVLHDISLFKLSRTSIIKNSFSGKFSNVVRFKSFHGDGLWNLNIATHFIRFPFLLSQTFSGAIERNGAFMWNELILTRKWRRMGYIPILPRSTARSFKWKQYSGYYLDVL